MVELDIEIWPTSIVVPKGHRIGALDPRQGLRLSGAEWRQAVELQERAHRLRAVPARRSARPAARDLRRHHQPSLQRFAAGLSAVAGDPIDKQTQESARADDAMEQVRAYGRPPARQAGPRSAPAEHHHRHPLACRGTGGGGVREAALRSDDEPAGAACDAGDARAQPEAGRRHPRAHHRHDRGSPSSTPWGSISSW